MTVPATPPPLDAGRLERAFDLVAGQVRDGRATYAALTVGRGDGPVASRAWLRGQPLDAPRRTCIASITKPITATAVLQLVEDGRLVLLEPIERYLPEFRPAPPPGAPGPLEPITAWHVLTHTAGLTDAPDSFFAAGAPTRRAMLERVCRDPLRFAPGTAFAYTTDSFYLLSALIERLSGLAYAEYLATRILRPLGMDATTFDPADPGPARLPLEGTLGPSGLPRDVVEAAFVALTVPGGGLWSVPDDVLRFGRAMLAGGTLDGVRILARPFVELMTRHHTANVIELGTPRPPNYGLGWGLPGRGRGSPASASAFGHGGATGSVLLVDPANDLVVVYLRNEWGAPTAPTDEAIQAVYAALAA